MTRMHPEEKQVKRAVAALALAPAAAAGSGLRQLCTRYPFNHRQPVRRRILLLAFEGFPFFFSSAMTSATVFMRCSPTGSVK